MSTTERSGSRGPAGKIFARARQDLGKIQDGKRSVTLTAKDGSATKKQKVNIIPAAGALKDDEPINNPTADTTSSDGNVILSEGSGKPVRTILSITRGEAKVDDDDISL